MKTKSEIYQMIIQEEIKAQNMYKSLAKASINVETKQILKNLVQIEKNHEEKITELFKAEFPKKKLVVNKKLNHDLTKIKGSLSPDAAIRFAISREEASEEIYLKLAHDETNEEYRQVFTQFAQDERNHKALLEDEILRQSGLMTWFDESELNGMMEY
jgi:rubrerythrin